MGGGSPALSVVLCVSTCIHGATAWGGGGERGGKCHVGRWGLYLYICTIHNMDKKNIDICIYQYMCMCVYYVYMCKRVYAHMCVLIYIYICICIYTHKYIHISIYLHIHIYK